MRSEKELESEKNRVDGDLNLKPFLEMERPVCVADIVAERVRGDDAEGHFKEEESVLFCVPNVIVDREPAA